MSESRSIIIRSEAIRSVATAAIKSLPVLPETPFEVVIRPYKAKRNLEQLALYWLRLADIEGQAWIDGKRYAADPVLHEHCKREYLPDVSASGEEKWTYMPSGERILNMGTGDLNVKEFAGYLTQVEAWGAGLGVMFSADRRGYDIQK